MLAREKAAYSEMNFRTFIVALAGLSAVAGFLGIVHAAGFGPLPSSLKNLPVPDVPGLLDGPDPIVVDKDKAIALGKALFWDMSVGSDGMACASCHFHAGADSRIKNQISPGGQSPSQAALAFDASATGAIKIGRASCRERV